VEVLLVLHRPKASLTGLLKPMQLGLHVPNSASQAAPKPVDIHQW